MDMDETTIGTTQKEDSMTDEEAAQLAAFAAAVEEEKAEKAEKEEKKSAEVFAGVPIEESKSSTMFEEVSEESGEKRPPRDIEFLLDIPLLVSVEIGRTRMLIKDLLQLGQGSVIEFDKLVGEPMEVLVNDKLIARGEVVVVNEKFGVRLTDISSPAERLKHLNK